jgi:hypothetical protein
MGSSVAAWPAGPVAWAEGGVELRFESALRGSVRGRDARLLRSVVVAEQGYGQAVMVKVAPLGRAVYSLIYSRVFQGPGLTMRGRINDWFAAHAEAYTKEVFAFRPDESWSDYMKGRINPRAP